jgi:hypothetical protein
MSRRNDMGKLGLRKLRCEVCGTEREVEAGIRTMFCCAQEMVEVEEGEEVEEETQDTKLKLSR